MTTVARQTAHDPIGLLAGNLVAWAIAAGVVVIATRVADPVSIFPTYFALGAVFVLVATLAVERPLLARYRTRLLGPTLWLALAVGGLALAIPGGILAAVVAATTRDAWGPGPAFVVGAVVFGVVGMWCALLGWIISRPLARSRLAVWIVVAVSALAGAFAIVALILEFGVR